MSIRSGHGSTAIAKAILVYLARQYGGDDWFPSDAKLAGRVTQWLSTAANEIFNSVAAARAYFLFKRPVDIAVTQQKSHALLQKIDEHLTARNWLECDRITIADIACYPYIALAGDGQISLEGYANIRQWMQHIQELPGFISMLGV
jgi:glutathione S-transferase